MKRLVLIMLLALVFVAVNFAEAQMQLKSALVSSGKGALTSGLDVNVNFESFGKNLILQGNSERVYVIFLQKIPLLGNAGVSGGLNQNMPWVGPYYTANLKGICLTYWAGWSGGFPEKPSFERNKMFTLLSFSTFLKGVGFGYNYLTYFGMKFSSPGINYAIRVSEDTLIRVSAEYELIGDKPYYNLGIEKKF